MVCSLVTALIPDWRPQPAVQFVRAVARPPGEPATGTCRGRPALRIDCRIATSQKAHIAPRSIYPAILSGLCVKASNPVRATGVEYVAECGSFGVLTFAAARARQSLQRPEAGSVVAGPRSLAAGPFLGGPASFRAREAWTKSGMVQSIRKAARLAWFVSGPRVGR
jgi:hypothetical protein